MLALVCVLASCKDNKDETPNTNETPTHTHAFGEWETTKAASCTAEGTKERYCTCGEKQTATISQTEHNYIDGICSSCGNNNNSGNNQSNTDEAKYNEACSLIEDGNYEEAYNILKKIKNYAPANDKLNNFFYAPTLIKEGYLTYTSGSNLGPSMEYDDMVYSYDEKGNIISITIPEYNKTYNYTYDSKGNELAGYPIDSPNSYNGARTCNYKNGKLIKISYSDSTDEYFYNDDGTLSKIVHTYQSQSSSTPSVYETVYTYAYYDNGSIKTMRYVDGYEGYEFQYNTNGTVTKVNVFDNEFSENYGYYSIIYGEFGVEKVEVYFTEDSESEPVGEMTYTYDTKGRLTEIMCYYEGELNEAYLFSGYELCYSENDIAKSRIAVISRTNIEKILEFMS